MTTNVQRAEDYLREEAPAPEPGAAYMLRRFAAWLDINSTQHEPTCDKVREFDPTWTCTCRPLPLYGAKRHENLIQYDAETGEPIRTGNEG